MVDETAAAWGKFQVVYAWLDQSLSLALFHLEQRSDPAEFELVRSRPFGSKIGDFQRFESAREGLLPGAEDRICDELRILQKWRNPRVHARIEIGNNESYSFALFDGRTRSRLPMNPPEIRGYTQAAIMLADSLHAVASYAGTANGIGQDLDELLAVIDPAE